MKLSVFYSIAPNSKLPDEYVWMSLFFSATYNAVCFRPNEIYTITSKERKKTHAHDLSCNVHHSLHKTIKMCVFLSGMHEIYIYIVKKR